MTKTQKNIIVLDEVDSTNNYANQLILSDAAEDGTVVMTHYQKSGKGQTGNSWESAKYQNLLASIILRPSLIEAAAQFEISKITSLALLDFLEPLAKNVKIKWPNDIYVGDKKIGGILIENSIKGKSLDSSIIGIGLNLNQTVFLSGAPNPVSLKQITAKDYWVEIVLEEIIKGFQPWYNKLKARRFDEIDFAYFSALYRNKGWHKFKRDKTVFEAKIIGIGAFGQLQLKNRSGEVLKFMFKEVEFVL